MDGSAAVGAQGPSSEKLLTLRFGRIPYYVHGVRAGLAALSLAEQHGPLDSIEIRVGGVSEPVSSTSVAVYTETVSSMAAIYSRLLLEFLGLKVGGTPSQLQEIKKRTHCSDIGIEKFRRADGTALAKVLPSIVDHFPDSRCVARAWVTACDFAGQRLAHVTDDFKVNGVDVTPMLVRTFETVPDLVTRAFYDELDRNPGACCS